MNTAYELAVRKHNRGLTLTEDEWESLWGGERERRRGAEEKLADAEAELRAWEESGRD